MNAAASRVLAPAIVVLLAAGIVSAAVVGGDDDDSAGAPATTSTSAPADDGVVTTASTSTSSTTTTTTTTTAVGADGTSTTRPAGSATTVTSAPGSGPPATRPTGTTTTTPAGPADLILHTNRYEQVGRVRFSVENAGPGAAPGIVVTLTGVPGAVLPGDGVTCEGSGTVTCRVAATGTGGLIGFVELAFAEGCPQVVASVASTVDDPDPASNSGSRALC